MAGKTVLSDEEGAIIFIIYSINTHSLWFTCFFLLAWLYLINIYVCIDEIEVEEDEREEPEGDAVDPEDREDEEDEEDGMNLV